MPGAPRIPQVLVVGSSFAGLTAALEVRRRLGARAEVVVVDRRDHFTFIPSLIWVPFRGRKPAQITFPLAPTYEDKGIRFIHDTAEVVDLEWRQVGLSRHGHLSYDRLLLATGPHLAFERIPGLGPARHTESVCTLEHALAARDSWDRLLAEPGPVVAGTAQGGSCFGASYEYALNAVRHLRRAGVQVPVTFVTSEPFLGHFGLGGVEGSHERVTEMFEKLGIEGLPNSTIAEVREGEIELASGRVLPFAHAMIVPPFRGVDMVRASKGLADRDGWIPVDEQYRHVDAREVFAAGVDVAIAPQRPTLIPTGVPKTGYMSEHMARVAAENIAADLGEGRHRSVSRDELGAVCILDGGNTGMILRTDSVLGDAEHTHLISGPQAHWAKVAFEKLFLSTRRRGLVRG